MIQRQDIQLGSADMLSSMARCQDQGYQLTLLQSRGQKALLRCLKQGQGSRLLIYVIEDAVKNLGHPVLLRDTWAWLASDQLACDLLQCCTGWPCTLSETLGLQAEQYRDIVLLRPQDSPIKFTADRVIDYAWHSDGPSELPSLKTQIEVEQGSAFRPDQDTEFYRKGSFTDLCHGLWNLNLLLEIGYFNKSSKHTNGADLL